MVFDFLLGKEKKVEREQKEQYLNYIISELERGNIAVLLGNNVNSVSNDEEPILDLFNISLSEVRTVRKGKYSGHRVRIVKGWWYYAGSMNSEPVDELREIDRGNLKVTRDKLVLDGAKRVMLIRYSDIASIENSERGIIVVRRGSGKKQYFEGVDRTTFGIPIGEKVYEQPLSGYVVKLIVKELIQRYSRK